jgi:CBS domain-containing protein
MKRLNIRDAFVGEPNAGQEGLAKEHDAGSEALLLAIRGGELTLVVPEGTDDARAAEAAECIRGVLHLENERVLTFEIQSGATGAFFDDERASFHRRRLTGGSVGLSAISSSHDYMVEPVTEEERQRLTAREVMTPDPITIQPEQPLQAAADLLVYHHVSGLPVVDAQGALVGIVSEADIIGKKGETVAEIMSRDVVSVDATASLEELAAVMNGRRVKRVPVLQDGCLIGIISRADVVKWVAGR